MNSRRISLVLALVIAVIGGVWFVASTDDKLPGGDPNGRILRSLRVEASQLAKGSVTVSVVTRPPHIDSCDGRKDTKGWTDEGAFVTVRPRGNQQFPAWLIANALERGWALESESFEPYASQWRAEVAHRRARLLFTAKDDGSFMISVLAQPPGPVPTGC